MESAGDGVLDDPVTLDLEGSVVCMLDDISKTVNRSVVERDGLRVEDAKGHAHRRVSSAKLTGNLDRVLATPAVDDSLDVNAVPCAGVNRSARYEVECRATRGTHRHMSRGQSFFVLVGIDMIWLTGRRAKSTRKKRERVDVRRHGCVLASWPAGPTSQGSEHGHTSDGREHYPAVRVRFSHRRHICIIAPDPLQTGKHAWPSRIPIAVGTSRGRCWHYRRGGPANRLFHSATVNSATA